MDLFDEYREHRCANYDSTVPIYPFGEGRMRPPGIVRVPQCAEEIQ